ncbi:MAG: hypothetical protein ACRDI2_25865, partial [Chloroflexota bacterium]
MQQVTFDQAPQRHPVAGREPAEGGRWAAFVHWAERFYASSNFGETELNTPLKVSERLRRARGALLAGSETWGTLLERAFGAPNELTSRPAQGRFLTWCTAHSDEAAHTLRALWDETPAPPAERIRAFLDAAGGRAGTLG